MRLLYVIYYFWNIFQKMVQSMSIASYTSDTQPEITCSKLTLETLEQGVASLWCLYC